MSRANAASASNVGTCSTNRCMAWPGAAAPAEELEREPRLVDLADALERRVLAQAEHLLEPDLVRADVEEVLVAEGGGDDVVGEVGAVVDPHVGALRAPPAPRLVDVARVRGWHRRERLA